MMKTVAGDLQLTVRLGFLWIVVVIATRKLRFNPACIDD